MYKYLLLVFFLTCICLAQPPPQPVEVEPVKVDPVPVPPEQKVSAEPSVESSNPNTNTNQQTSNNDQQEKQQEPNAERNANPEPPQPQPATKPEQNPNPQTNESKQSESGSQQPNQQPSNSQSQQQQQADQRMSSEERKRRRQEIEKQRQQRQQQQEKKRQQQQEQTARQRRQRSEKYKVEQERVKQIRRKQKQAQERMKQERAQVEPQVVTYESDGQLSKTEQIKTTELDNFRKARRSGQSPDMTEFHFEMKTQMDEFSVTPSTNQYISLSIRIFTHRDNQYSEMSDVEKEGSVKIFIYENNQRIVTQGEFRFRGWIGFQGQPGLPYTIRFYNQKVDKLIEVRHTLLVEKSDVQNLLSTEQAQQHAKKAKQALSKVTNTVSDRKKSYVLEMNDSRSMNKKLENYLIYEIIQMIAVIILCVSQVQLIKSMLNKQSIV